MPCYRCGARQTDPVRGPSPWKRAVYSGAQILVCPDCQEEGEWRSEVDRCASCQSVELIRVLGETLCRSCGATNEAGGPLVPEPRSSSPGGRALSGSAAEEGRPPGPAGAGRPPGLADEVAAALDRLFQRHGSSTG
jgi:hypothetical protein